MSYENDAQIVDESTRIRLSELEVQKEKVHGRTKLGLALIILVGGGYFFTEMTDMDAVRQQEQTRRDAALSVEAQVAREQSLTDVARIKYQEAKMRECKDLLAGTLDDDRLRVFKNSLKSLGCDNESLK